MGLLFCCPSCGADLRVNPAVIIDGKPKPLFPRIV